MSNASTYAPCCNSRPTTVTNAVPTAVRAERKVHVEVPHASEGHAPPSRRREPRLDDTLRRPVGPRVLDELAHEDRVGRRKRDENHRVVLVVGRDEELGMLLHEERPLGRVAADRERLAVLAHAPEELAAHASAGVP